MTSILLTILIVASILIFVIPNSIDLDEKLCTRYGILKYSEVDNLYQFGLDDILLEEDEVREYINMVNRNETVYFQVTKLSDNRYTILQKFGRGGKFRVLKQTHSNTDPTPIEFNKFAIALAYCDELVIRQYPRTRRLAGTRFD